MYDYDKSLAKLFRNKIKLILLKLVRKGLLPNFKQWFGGFKKIMEKLRLHVYCTVLQKEIMVSINPDWYTIFT